VRRKLALVFVIGLLVLTACRRTQEDREEVLSFIARTEALAREFVYEAEEDGRSIEVQGVFEDSLRFHALLRIDGADVLEQVVDDDSLAVRVIDPTKIPSLAEGTAAGSTIILDALRSGQWVLDPSGAPPLTIRVDEEIPTGQDAVLDAAGALNYARLAAEQAAEVKEWQAEDLEPAYRPFEDHFPEGNPSAGIRRFDLVRRGIPRPTQELGTFEVEPEASMFRRMVIYVKDGRIFRIIEEVDIAGHPDFVDAKEQGKTQMLEFLEQIQALTGSRAVEEREMTIVFRNIGEETTVRPPPEPLRASLRGIFSPVGEGEELPADAQQTGQEAEPPSQ
jgi:hypothetical protein